MSHEEKRNIIDPSQLYISITRQAEILGISRASIYYQPRINETDIRIMHAIDEIYTKRPYFGSRRIKDTLEDRNIFICREIVRPQFWFMSEKSMEFTMRSSSLLSQYIPVSEKDIVQNQRSFL